MKIPSLLLLFYCVGACVFAAPDTLDASFQSGPHRMHGTLLLPEDRSEKMPVVIFLVGSGGNSSHATNYAGFLQFFLEHSLSGRKMALLYFDKRGVGRSEGVWYRTDFEQRAFDARNAAVYLKTLPFIDPARIYLVGHSQGGWIVQVCLAEYPDLFAGGVSMAGATFGVRKQLVNDYRSALACGGGLRETQAHEKANRKVNRILAFTSVFPLKQDWKQLKRIRKFEAAPYLLKIKRPILFMWGENDPLVSARWCLDELNGLFPQAIPAHIETYVAAGENHSFKPTARCHAGKTKDIPYSARSREKLTAWLLDEAGRR